MSVEDLSKYFEPLFKSVEVQVEPARAFTVFTKDIAKWWPLNKTYSVFGDRSQECGIEPFVGGEIYELSADGERTVWGRILVWEPGHRLCFSWYPGRTEETAQTVEVSFAAVAGGTRVDLEHRDWQTLGPKAPDVRRGYDGGWDEVLGRLLAYASKRHS